MDTNILNFNIANGLSDISEIYGENYQYSIREGMNDFKKQCYILDVVDLDENKNVGSFYTKEKFTTIVENLDSFVGAVYFQEINCKKSKIKYIKNNYLMRKIEQLAKATNENNQSKIQKINDDMVKKYKEVMQYKSEVDDYQELIEKLYSVKESLQR